MQKQKNNTVLNLSKKDKSDSLKSSLDTNISKTSIADDWINKSSVYRHVGTYHKRKRDPFDTNKNDDDDFQKSESEKRKAKEREFTKPVKKKRFINVDKESNSQVELLLESVNKINTIRDDKEEQETCPFCHDILKPVTAPIRKHLDQFKREDMEHIKRQQSRQEKEDAMSSFSRPSDLITEKRYVSSSDKHEFCKLHHLELVLKPLGKSRGYPASIDFDAIENRVKRFQPQLDDVISGRIQSQFKKMVTDAYDEFGTGKARSATNVMLRVKECLPGYYGMRGSTAISSALSKIYLQSGLLTKGAAKPLLPLEYIQQVLVPEVGVRLIRQDLVAKSTQGKSGQRSILDYANKIPSNLTETAEKIMVESREYGSAMFPAIEEDFITVYSDDEN